MNDLLKQTLDEVSALAAALSRQVAKTDGKVAPLLIAQAVVTADKLRTRLRRLASKLEAAIPRPSETGR